MAKASDLSQSSLESTWSLEEDGEEESLSYQLESEEEEVNPAEEVLSTEQEDRLLDLGSDFIGDVVSAICGVKPKTDDRLDMAQGIVDLIRDFLLDKKADEFDDLDRGDQALSLSSEGDE